MGWTVHPTLIYVTFTLVLAAAEEPCSSATIFGLNTADCISRGFTEIPYSLSSDTKVLKLSGNQLAELDARSFVMYPALQELVFSNNQISMIHTETYYGIYNLQHLNYEGNKLNVVPTDSFQYLTSLRTLVLKNNPIKFIARDAFKHLVNIEEINLENCWIQRLEIAAFVHLSKLISLNLASNELRTISPDMEYRLPTSLSVLRLYSNPWRCDCKLRWLRKKLTSPHINWIFLPNSPSCAGPELLAGLEWKSLTSDQFACPSQIVASNSTIIEVTRGGNVTIECIISGDPEPVIVWKKDGHVIDKSHVLVNYITMATGETRIHSVVKLKHVSDDTSGDYQCIAENPAGRAETAYKVAVIGSAAAVQGGKVSHEIVMGVIAGGIILLLLVAFCILCIVVKRSREKTLYRMEQSNAINRREQNKTENIYKRDMEPQQQRLLQDTDKRIAQPENTFNRIQDVTTSAKQRDVEVVSPENGLLNADDKPDDDVTSLQESLAVVSEEEDESSTEFTMKIFSYPDHSPEEAPRQASSTSPRPASDQLERHSPREVRLQSEAVSRFSPELPDDQQNSVVDRSGSEAERKSFDLPDERLGTSSNRRVTTSYDNIGGLDRKTISYDNPKVVKILTKDNQDNYERTRSGGHVMKCSNPICLKDRYGTVQHPPSSIEMCSHRMAMHGAVTTQPHYTRRLTHESPDTSAPSDVDDRCSSLPLTIDSGQLARSDHYATLPAKAAKSSYRSTAERYRADQLPAANYLRATAYNQTELNHVRMLTKSQPSHLQASKHLVQSNTDTPDASFHSSTSLNDLLSPSIGATGIQVKQKSGDSSSTTTQRRNPRPGEQDEFGTAV